IVTGVQRAVLEPLDRHVVRIVGGVLHLGERPDPVDARGLSGPETVRVVDRPRIHFLIFRVVDPGLLAPLCRNGVNLFAGHSTPPTPQAARGPGRFVVGRIMRRRLSAGQGARGPTLAGDSSTSSLPRSRTRVYPSSDFSSGRSRKHPTSA